MERIKVKLFIHKSTLGDITPCTSDMSTFGWPLLGVVDVEVPVPEVDFVAAEIEALKTQADEIMGEAKKKAGDIQVKIQSLKGKQNDK
jgi:hypothetical protein